MDARSPDRIRYHYEIERELADVLRQAPPAKRRGLYGDLYEALFARVPDHPLLTGYENERFRTQEVDAETRFLGRFIRPGCTFLDIGAGDCELARAISRTAGTVYALDVSRSIMTLGDTGGLVPILSDGISIDVPAGTVDLAYSNQLMEHLHPDDAQAQLSNIRRALAPGGRYVCCTPNRLNGPHDVSRYFDKVATGFHLKEYTVAELVRLMCDVGFSRIDSYVQVKGVTRRVPVAALTTVEAVLQWLPPRAGRSLAGRRPWRNLLGIRLVAQN